MARRNSTETIEFLTREEMEALLKAIPNKRDKAVFLMAYRHGLRASEVGMLRVSDIDFKGQRIKLHRLKGSLDGNHTM